MTITVPVRLNPRVFDARSRCTSSESRKGVGQQVATFACGRTPRAETHRRRSDGRLSDRRGRRIYPGMSLPKPPVAAKHPQRIEQLGRVRVDDYAWMKDEGWQQVLRDPKALRADVREHLDAENAYTRTVLAGTEALQATLFAEMKGRIKEDDSSVPAPDGPFDYYVRYDLGAEHPIHARRPRGQDQGEEVLLDEEALSKGKAFFQVGAAHQDR